MHTIHAPTHPHKYNIYYTCLFIVRDLKLKIDQQPQDKKARNVERKFIQGERAGEEDVRNFNMARGSEFWPARPSLRAPISLCVCAYEVLSRMV